MMVVMSVVQNCLVAGTQNIHQEILDVTGQQLKRM